MDLQLSHTQYNINNVTLVSVIEYHVADSNTSPKEYHVLDESILSEQYPYPGLIQNNIPRVHSMPCSFRKIPSDSTS